jgi:molybdopterin adenylyltransferase
MTDQRPPGEGSARRSALVLTASDRSAAGDRPDTSGALVADRLLKLGYEVERQVLPDDRATLEAALIAGTDAHPLVVTTGGTGLTPRDVTPQATLAVIEYEVPGIGEAMRSDGRRSTAFAVLSRGVAGVRGRSLIINLPGSPKAALESLEVVEPVLDHALETLAGPFDHGAARAEGRLDLPPVVPSGAPARPGAQEETR